MIPKNGKSIFLKSLKENKLFSFDHIVVCKRKRFEFFNISFLRKRAYSLSFTQNVINKVIEDLHYIRRYYESHSKTTFLRIYRVVVQIFSDFLKKQNDLNETFYIYTSSSSKSSNEYESDSNIVFIFSQSDICDLFDLIVKTSSFSFSFNFYHREISIEFWKWLIILWIWFSQIFRCWFC